MGRSADRKQSHNSAGTRQDINCPEPIPLIAMTFPCHASRGTASVNIAGPLCLAPPAEYAAVASVKRSLLPWARLPSGRQP